MTEKEKALFYRNLREQLEKDYVFPSIYVFELMVALGEQEEKITQIKSLFDPTVLISTQDRNETKILKIQTVMISSLDIIRIYKEAAKIEGVSLRI